MRDVVVLGQVLDTLNLKFLFIYFSLSLSFFYLITSAVVAVTASNKSTQGRMIFAIMAISTALLLNIFILHVVIFFIGQQTSSIARAAE